MDADAVDGLDEDGYADGNGDADAGVLGFDGLLYAVDAAGDYEPKADSGCAAEQAAESAVESGPFGGIAARYDVHRFLLVFSFKFR